MASSLDKNAKATLFQSNYIRQYPYVGFLLRIMPSSSAFFKGSSCFLDYECVLDLVFIRFINKPRTFIDQLTP